MPDPRTHRLLGLARATALTSMSDLAREDQRRVIRALEQLDTDVGEQAGSIDIKAIPHCAVPQRSFCLHLRPRPRVCREMGVVRYGFRYHPRAQRWRKLFI